MEATDVYHEGAAYYLHAKGFQMFLFNHEKNKKVHTTSRTFL
jgi:transposase